MPSRPQPFKNRRPLPLPLSSPPLPSYVHVLPLPSTLSVLSGPCSKWLDHALARTLARLLCGAAPAPPVPCDVRVHSVAAPEPSGAQGTRDDLVGAHDGKQR